MRWILLALLALGCDDGGSEAPAPDAEAADARADGALDGAVEGPDGSADAALDGGVTPDVGRADEGAPDAGDPDAASPDAGTGAFTACAVEDRVGGFAVTLANGFTGVQGQVADGVTPSRVPAVSQSDGPCDLLVPRMLFCEDGCAAGETCGDGGECVPLPGNVDVGTVAVTGLKAPVRMTASAPVWFYTNRDPLDHPGFDPGAAIGLTATGADPIAPFALRGWGVTTLSVTTQEFVLQSGTPAVVEWATPDDVGPARVHLELNIANHGGTPGRIECDVDDTGRFEIPAPLVDALLAQGYSGFPSLSVNRLSVDAADTTVGCVELRVQSEVVLDVTIPGLTSCSGDEDCPEGEFCQGDLTCGGGE